MDYISMNIQVFCVLWLAGMWCGLVLSPLRRLSMSLLRCFLMWHAWRELWESVWCFVSRFVVSVCVSCYGGAGWGPVALSAGRRLITVANAGHPIDTHSFNTATHTHTHLLYLPASKTSLLRHATHTQHTHKTYIDILVCIEEFCCFLTTTFSIYCES